ncbi:universal stress protein [Bacillus marinisedimentorum]|uniref:universal stress protein n=1 Tax=Bacillus marinisedimentorum TaxID=1821260 RepID=UPI000872C5AA|nr:universal stress protein [Bacillus marinisedimentorum]
MTKILVTSDGSENSVRAAEFIVKHYGGKQDSDAPAVVILNVQPPLHSSHARMFISKEDLGNYYYDEGMKDVSKLVPIFEKAGIVADSTVETGDPAEKIVETAEDINADIIIMGTRGMGSVKNMVMGSTSTKVLHLSNIPVTLVK